MNFVRKSLIIISLIITLIYTVNITNIPRSVILFENEELELGEIFGLTLKEEKKEVLEALSNTNKKESKTMVLSLFNLIKVKEVEVSTIENVRVIPLGNTIGIKLYSSGVLVIGMTEVAGCKPYENTGIKEGDLIIEVDNVEVTTTGELVKCVNNSQRRKTRNKIY